MRKFAGFTIGAVLGGLVGATLALLFTPESGVELRAQIRARADSFAAEIRQAVTTKRIELQDRLEIMRAPKEP
jgi:gas vesicle protein